jgi:hypothetical protein
MTVRPRRKIRPRKKLDTAAAHTAAREPGPPVVARLGFDHGWLCLSPSFLNLQLPVLLVDHRLLPDPARLGLEPFGSRDPRLPLPTTRIVVQYHPSAMISIWDHHPGDPSAQLLGWHRATATGDTQQASWERDGDTSPKAVVCWAAVWDSHIGHAQLIDSTRRTVSRAGADGYLSSGFRGSSPGRDIVHLFD